MTGTPLDPRDPVASVWACGDDGLGTQLARRGYHDETCADVAVLPPVLAEHIVATYSRPGDIVLDPDCGAGTTIVEALRGGRHAIGLTADPRWWPVARANVTAVKASGAAVDGMVLVLDRTPGTLASAHTAGLAGRLDLVVTTLRPHDPVAPHPPTVVARFGDLLSRSRPLLRDGGHVVVAMAPLRCGGELVDLCGPVLSAALACGLTPIARIAALTARLTRGRVVTHASLAQRRLRMHAGRQTGHPVCTSGHLDVLVLRGNDAAEAEPSRRLPDRVAHAALAHQSAPSLDASPCTSVDVAA